MTCRSRSMLNKSARIERSVIVHDITNIRDRKIQQWAIVKENVPVRLEPSGADIVSDANMGRILVERYTAYFLGNEPVRANDRLLVDAVYYIVEGVQNFSEYDAHVQAFVRKMNYAQS